MKTVLIKSPETSSQERQLTLLFIVVMILILCVSCVSRVVVVSSDKTETKVKAGQAFTPTTDGVFMGFGRYQEYRQAVADQITAETPTNSAK